VIKLNPQNVEQCQTKTDTGEVLFVQPLQLSELEPAP